MSVERKNNKVEINKAPHFRPEHGSRRFVTFVALLRRNLRPLASASSAEVNHKKIAGMASIEASASANADKFYSKYLQLAYSYPSSRQPSRESQFATPEDLEFAEADENLLQRLSLAEDAAAYEQIQEKVGSCQMKLYTRDVGDWVRFFFSQKKNL